MEIQPFMMSADNNKNKRSIMQSNIAAFHMNQFNPNLSLEQLQTLKVQSNQLPNETPLASAPTPNALLETTQDLGGGGFDGWDDFMIPDPTPVGQSKTGNDSYSQLNLGSFKDPQQQLQLQQFQNQQQHLLQQQQQHQQQLQQEKLKQQLRLKQQQEQEQQLLNHHLKQRQQQQLIKQQQLQQQQQRQTTGFQNLFEGQTYQQQLDFVGREQQQKEADLTSLSMEQLNNFLSNNTNNSEVLQQLIDSGTNLQDLFSPRPVAENAASSSDNKNNQRLFLETRVEPVSRSKADPNFFANEDDLFKMFGMDQADDNIVTGHDVAMMGSVGTNKRKHPSESSEPVELAPGNSSFSVPEPTALSSETKEKIQQPALHEPSPATAESSVVSSFDSKQPEEKSDSAFLLPSTMMPPSVLASVFASDSDLLSADKSSKKKAEISKAASRGSSSGGKSRSRTESKSPRTESPQDALLRIMNSQGHSSVQRIRCEDAGYDTTPSQLQLASFGTELVKAVHTSNVDLLRSLISCGLSPNPCNQFRDSILDLVCKRANEEIFLCLLENGADVRVCDGFGRTPLHHCAWASEFCKQNAEAILERDPLQLVVEDKRGQTPMEYVRSSLAGEWIDFLESKRDLYWPKGGEPKQMQRPKDNRRDGSLPDPENAISVTLAALVSSGKVKPQEVAELDEATRKNFSQSNAAGYK